MAVREQAVGGEVLGDGREVVGGLGLAARARHAAGRVDDHTHRLDGAGANERRERERCGGDVAPGRRHQVGGPHVVAEQLGDAEGELAQQLGGLVLLAVPDRIEGGILQPEVGGQVDDLAHPLAQVGHDRL